jgi:UDP-N-acetyl-D-glucosamine dehydrogenase
MDETQHTFSIARDRLEHKLRNRSVHMGVLGLGWRGLPIAVSLAQAGFAVTGIDVDGHRVAAINAGCVADAAVPDDVLSLLVCSRQLRATQSLMTLECLDVVTVCVPTLFSRRAQPDLSCLIAAAEAIRIHLHPGLLIMIDTQVTPGVPADVLLPILHRSGLRVGADFFLASRLRHVVPGPWLDRSRAASTNVVGVTAYCRELAALYYQHTAPRHAVAP